MLLNISPTMHGLGKSGDRVGVLKCGNGPSNLYYNDTRNIIDYVSPKESLRFSSVLADAKQGAQNIKNELQALPHGDSSQ